MNILLIGPQGSGKGTQADLLVKDFNLYHLDSGELIREAAKKDKEINQIVNVRGELLPDEVSFRIVTQKLNKERPERDNILFDGYPRSVAQYLLLKDWLGQLAQKIDKAILINISDDEAVRRLSARRICKSCGRIWNLVEFPKPPSPTICICGGELYQRKDDTPVAISERLKIYKDITGPLTEMLDGEGKLFEVGGEHPIEDIYSEISQIIQK